MDVDGAWDEGGGQASSPPQVLCLHCGGRQALGRTCDTCGESLCAQCTQTVAYCGGCGATDQPRGAGVCTHVRGTDACRVCATCEGKCQSCAENPDVCESCGEPFNAARVTYCAHVRARNLHYCQRCANDCPTCLYEVQHRASNPLSLLRGRFDKAPDVFAVNDRQIEQEMAEIDISRADNDIDGTESDDEADVIAF